MACFLRRPHQARNPLCVSLNASGVAPRALQAPAVQGSTVNPSRPLKAHHFPRQWQTYMQCGLRIPTPPPQKKN
eukprot:2520678-Amphidinium_carterae.1